MAAIAQIGITITQPNLDLHIRHPDLDIHTQSPDLALKTTKPEVIIDLRESYNSMGLKDIASSMQSFVEDAKQTVLAGIQRRADEGDALSNPKGPSVVQLAYQAAQPKEKQLHIGLMPSVPPKITAKLGKVEGIFTSGKVSVKLNPGQVKGVFTWGKVDVYLERQSSIDIKA